MADFSFIGVGKVYLREAGSSAGLIEVGNMSNLALAVTEDVKELKDYTQVGGGTYNEVRRIDSVELTGTMHDLSSDNLAKALFGDASAIAATPVADEPHTAYHDAVVPTDLPCDGTITVTDTGGATTYILDTDYERVPGGVKILSTGAITDGQAIEFDYTPNAGNAVHALLNSAKEFEVFFSGLNEARSGKQVTLRCHRWKMGAAQNLPLIGDDYAALEVTGKLLKDSTKNGTTESQYFNLQIVS